MHILLDGKTHQSKISYSLEEIGLKKSHETEQSNIEPDIEFPICMKLC